MAEPACSRRRHRWPPGQAGSGVDTSVRQFVGHSSPVSLVLYGGFRLSCCGPLKSLHPWPTCTWAQAQVKARNSSASMMMDMERFFGE